MFVFLYYVSVTGILGYMRLFDKSMFAPPDADGNTKTVTEILKDDIGDIQKIVTNISSALGMGSKKKEDP